MIHPKLCKMFADLCTSVSIHVFASAYLVIVFRFNIYNHIILGADQSACVPVWSILTGKILNDQI